MIESMVYISGPNEWYFFDGETKSLSKLYPNNSGANTGLKLEWGPCVAVPRDAFPNCF